jgi:hypothetical protein
MQQVDPVTQIEFDRGIQYLKDGDYLKGWPLWDLRYGPGNIGQPIESNTKRGYTQPYWRGEPTEGVTIVDDQGYGDAFQFLRYIPLLQQRCKVVEIAPKPGIAELLLDSFPGVRLISFRRHKGDMWFWSNEMYPYHLLTSLGGLFKTTIDTIPNQMPYIKAGRRQIDGKHIGLCWTTDMTCVDNYHTKTIPYELIRPLLDRPDVMSLQMEHLNVGTWQETATIINGLSLVITGDFGIAHLAGALGKPIWVMLSHDCDWRWQTGDRSPWYPTASLYRQDRPGDWQSVLDKIHRRLERLPYHFPSSHRS